MPLPLFGLFAVGMAIGAGATAGVMISRTIGKGIGEFLADPDPVPDHEKKPYYRDLFCEDEKPAEKSGNQSPS